MNQAFDHIPKTNKCIYRTLNKDNILVQKRMIDSDHAATLLFVGVSFSSFRIQMLAACHL